MIDPLEFLNEHYPMFDWELFTKEGYPTAKYTTSDDLLLITIEFDVGGEGNSMVYLQYRFIEHSINNGRAIQSTYSHGDWKEGIHKEMKKAKKALEEITVQATKGYGKFTLQD